VEYVCTIVIPSKKEIIGNWIEMKIYGDKRPINNKTKLDYFLMSIPEDCLRQCGTLEFSTH